MLPLFSTPGISATTFNASLVLVLFQLFPLFRFLGCVKDRCNECAPCAITCPARLPYSTGYEAILSRKGNNVATTPPKAPDAFFLFLRNMHASTLRSALVNLRSSHAFSGRFYLIPIDLRLRTRVRLRCRAKSAGRSRHLSSVKQPEMSKWTVILLLVRHPLFHFNQTMVGPLDFLQYLLCVRILFAMCALPRTFSGFDVLTQPQYGGRHHLLHRPSSLLICRHASPPQYCG